MSEPIYSRSFVLYAKEKQDHCIEQWYCIVRYSALWMAVKFNASFRCMPPARPPPTGDSNFSGRVSNNGFSRHKLSYNGVH